MRTWAVASAFAVIVAGSSFYAVVGSPFAKVEPRLMRQLIRCICFPRPKVSRTPLLKTWSL